MLSNTILKQGNLSEKEKVGEKKRESLRDREKWDTNEDKERRRDVCFLKQAKCVTGIEVGVKKGSHLKLGDPLLSVEAIMEGSCWSEADMRDW